MKRSKYIKKLSYALMYGMLTDSPLANTFKHNLGLRRFKVVYKDYKKNVTLQQLLRG